MRCGSLSLPYVVIGLVVVATAVIMIAGSTGSIGGFFDAVNEQLVSAQPGSGQTDETAPGSTTGSGTTGTSDTSTDTSAPTSTSVTPPADRPTEFRPE